MFTTLFGKEIREHLLTFRFGAALLTVFVLVVVSAWVLGDDYLHRRDTYNLLVEESTEADAEVLVPSQISPVLNLPPSPLSIFAQGAEGYLGHSIRVSRWEVPIEASESLADNVLVSAQHSLDLLSIITVVLSLFAVLLSYDLISGEREHGTLSLVCTNSVSRASLYSAKFAASCAILAIPVVLSFVCSILVLQFVHGLSFTGGQWLAISLMAAAAILYGALFVGLAMLASALARKSSTALIISLLLWTLLVWIVPVSASGLASALYPLPSRGEITDFEKTTWADLEEKALQALQANRGEGVALRGALGTDVPANVIYNANPAGFRMVLAMMRFSEPLWQERADQIWNMIRRHNTEYQKQAEMADILGFLSPAQHLRNGFTSLADTNIAANDRFVDAARRFREQLLNNFAAKGYFGENMTLLFSRVAPANAFSQEQFEARGAEVSSLDDPDFERFYEPLASDLIPRFELKGGSPQLPSALNAIAVLAIMTVIVFALGLSAFLRYDIREG